MVGRRVQQETGGSVRSWHARPDGHRQRRKAGEIPSSRERVATVGEDATYPGVEGQHLRVVRVHHRGVWLEDDDFPRRLQG